jgi:hypothetical protein
MPAVSADTIKTNHWKSFVVQCVLLNGIEHIFINNWKLVLVNMLICQLNKEQSYMFCFGQADRINRFVCRHYQFEVKYLLLPSLLFKGLLRLDGA